MNENELLEKIGKEIRLFQSAYKDIYFLTRFAAGDQWRNEFWERIALDNIPTRVHNKIAGYKRTLTAYFIQSYPKLALSVQSERFRTVAEKLEKATNAIISDPFNFGMIASAFSSSLITGVSVLKLSPLPKSQKIEISEIPLYNIYSQMGEINMRKLSYVVERYVASDSEPFKPISLPKLLQLNLPEGYSVYYAIYYRNADAHGVKIVRTSRRQISYEWDTSALVNPDGLEVIDGIPPVDDFPFVFIQSSPEITNIFDYKLSETYAAKDIQIFINKLVSYSDLVMGITALGIAKIRNMPATEVDLYPGAKIPLPEGSDIAIDRGIGLNFNFEAYNLSSALADDIFGINEILRGVRPQSVTSGVAVKQLYDIALSRLQLKIPVISLMLRRIAILVARSVLTFEEFQDKFQFTDEDIKLLRELVENEQFEVNVSPTVTDTRNPDDILNSMIRLAQAGVLPPQTIFSFLKKNYPYFFENELEDIATKLVTDKILLSVSNYLKEGDMPIGQAVQQAQQPQVPPLSPEGRQFLASVGIDPDSVTPDVIQEALMIMQDPARQKEIQDMIQTLVQRGYTEGDAQKFVFALLVKAILDRKAESSASPAEPSAPQPPPTG